MSSAAKLRYLGRGTAVAATAALVITSFGPTAFAAWQPAPQGGSVQFANPNIGIVDADNVTAGTQGATLVQAGQTAQALSNVRLVIPNSFRMGDTIDLRILDRSATETTNGRGNAGPSTKMEFSKNPSVAVSGPKAPATQVDPTNQTNEASVNNTEGTLKDWAAQNPSATDVYNTKPSITPAFDVSLVASTGSNYKDTIRLRVNTDPSKGDPTAQWVVTLSDLAMDLGVDVTPGELRLVPFAYNNDNNVLVAEPDMFAGNVETQARIDGRGTLASVRTIGEYTVPAYVSPINITTQNQNIVSDGTPQSVGALTIEETNAFSLRDGQYTLHLSGAQVANTALSSIKGAVTNGNTNEQVTIDQINKDSIVFTLSGVDTTHKATITLSGVQLVASAPGQISWSLDGGSVSSWLANASDANGAITVAGTQVAAPSSAFSTAAAATATTYQVDPTTTGAALTGAGAGNVGTYAFQAPVQTASGAAASKLTQAGIDAIVADAQTAGDTYFQVINNGGVLEIQSSSDNGVNDPWATVGAVNTNTTYSDTADGLTATAANAFSQPLAAGDTFRIQNIATYTFTPLGGQTGAQQQFVIGTATLDGMTVSTQPNAAGNITIAETPGTAGVPGVNQDDIVAPADKLIRTGTASAGITSIGGTNRFGTAARIASEYVKSTGRPTADTAIIVNGMAAPDALSSSFLSQREGAPILLTAPGQLPAETVEALRDLGVRKVYIVGGKSAVGSAVFDALKNQNAYMWDDAAKAIKPRGDKLEVVQLGGDNRYETNWRVNTYAASQTAAAAPVGKLSTGVGVALKTSAMVARSSTANDFTDALSASVLSAGRAGGLYEERAAGATQIATVSTGTFTLLNAADAVKIPTGQYRLVTDTVNNQPVQNIVDANNAVVGTWTANNLVFTDPAVGTIPLAGVAANGNVFSVAANPNAGAVYGYDSTVGKVNALPTILTTPGALRPEAAAQFKALHIEHALLIGGNDALAPKVNDDIAAQNATSYRIEGANRWETAANVNRFAMNDQAASATNQVPGLGFDGSHVYDAATGGNRVGGEMVAYLANGMKFPDALVAGPWVSRTRNAMVMTLADELPAETAKFISEKAPQIDRAAGLGQGDAVSSKVLVEANQIASSK